MYLDIFPVTRRVEIGEGWFWFFEEERIGTDLGNSTAKSADQIAEGKDWKTRESSFGIFGKSGKEEKFSLIIVSIFLSSTLTILSTL